MADLTDAELWERVRADDAGAFGELYERHARSVQSYCLWRTAALQLAEDVTATTFLEAWRRRRRLELTTESAAPLLLGMATNLMRNHWRGQRRHARALERIAKADSQLSPSHEDEVAARVDAMLQVREAGAAIRALPLREREVLALLAWGELSYVETAAALGVPVGTVRSRVSRARSRLGDAFADLARIPTLSEDPLP
jgi:RNA polymerase sigma-70 factor (ECF subfamily)